MALAAGKQRVVLASLLVRANRLVTIAELVDRIWGEHQPTDIRSALHMHVMRLRKALGAASELIQSRPGGYLIELPPDALDLLCFNDRLVRAERARADSDLAAEAAELAAGLALWRGEPLVDVPSEALRRAEVPFLVERRLLAQERHFEIDLQLGRNTDAIGELRKLVADNPLRERLWALLMTALYRCGRQAEALDAYHQVRRLLADELGLDPGPALLELHRKILTKDSALTGQPSSTAAAPGWAPVRQLPAATVDIVGRAELAKRVRQHLTGAGGAPVLVLSGPPGVGKTALAVHAAHQLAREFPDGQLWVDLRGYSGGAAMNPVEALSRFLRSLGAPPEQIALAGPDELSSLFRQFLAGRRMVIVLDNAVGAEQVRPLLPGTPRCAVIVTSRANLAGLTATHGAVRIPVPALTTDEAVHLLRRMLGAAAVSAEPQATTDLAVACGLLPLALRIAAASLAEGGDSIAGYLRRLRADRIGELAIDGDDHAAVRVAFDHSYARLEPEAARLFRLLSLNPGPDFDWYAAAHLAGLPPEPARRILRQLASANLVQQQGDRYRLHDLLRDYAAGRSQVHDAAEAGGARRRLFGYYLSGADAAARLLYPERWRAWPLPAATAESVANVRQEWGADRAAAWSWLEVERANLVAAVRHDLGGVELPGWLLTDALYGFFTIRRYLDDWNAVLTTGLQAAVARGDGGAEATLRLHLGALKYQLGRLSEAGREYTHALHHFRRLGDTRGQSAMHNNLGTLAYYQGDPVAALDHYQRALIGHLASADSATVVRALNNLGYACEIVGDLDGAERYIAESLAITRGDPGLLALRTRGLLELGWIHLARGRLASAARALEQGASLAAELGLGPDQATAADLLARVHLAAGRHRQVGVLASQALSWAVDNSSHEQRISAHNTLGALDLRLDRTAGAAHHFAEAHFLAVQTEHRSLDTWEAVIGQAACHRRFGDLGSARAAADTVTGSPVRSIQALAHLELARIDHAIGDHRAAVDQCAKAIDISRGCGYRLIEAHALQLSGRTLHAIGETAAARSSYRRALAIYRDAGAESADLADQLDRLDQR